MSRFAGCRIAAACSDCRALPTRLRLCHRAHPNHTSHSAASPDPQPVAIKVVDLLPTQRKQVAAAWRECQLISRVQHECIVQVVSFYSAQVQQRQHIMKAM